jgi:hypothetical protein
MIYWALQGEAQRLRQTLTPYILQLRASVLLHQWSQRRCIVHNSELPEEHVRVYRQYVSLFTASFLAKELLAESGMSGGSSVSKGDMAEGHSSRGLEHLHQSGTNLSLQGSTSEAPAVSNCGTSRVLSPSCVPVASLPLHCCSTICARGLYSASTTDPTTDPL